MRLNQSQLETKEGVCGEEGETLMACLLKNKNFHCAQTKHDNKV